MAKMGIQQIAERKVALQRLNQIELGTAADAVEQVTEGGHEVINNKKQRQWPFGRGHTHKPDFFRAGVFELDRKDGKVMLRRQRPKHRQMAAPNRIVARYLEVENGDAHAEFPLAASIGSWRAIRNFVGRSFSTKSEGGSPK
jgi:hypothetical protein